MSKIILFLVYVVFNYFLFTNMHNILLSFGLKHYFTDNVILVSSFFYLIVTWVLLNRYSAKSTDKLPLFVLPASPFAVSNQHSFQKSLAYVNAGDVIYYAASFSALIYFMITADDAQGFFSLMLDVTNYHTHFFPMYAVAALFYLTFIGKGKDGAFNFAFIISHIAVFSIFVLMYDGFKTQWSVPYYYINGSQWLQLWDFNITFYTDSLSIVFLLLTHFLLLICVFLIIPTLGVDPKGYLAVVALVILWIQLVFTFTAGDLLLFFVAFESLMIPLLFLIGIWGSPNRLQANNYLYFYTTVGAAGMLVSILYLWQVLETTDIFVLSFLCDAHLTWSEKLWLWVGFFLSFAIKTPMVPFHIWLPKAHVEAPTTGSVLLAGLLLKIGLYGFLRICISLFPDVSAYAAPVVSTLAIVGVIYASLITLRQIDMKRIIAYSSVAHMSLSLASVMTGSSLGIAGGVFLSLSHGIVSSSLFILVGALYARFHNRLVAYYGGLITWMPYFGLAFFFFSLANMAFPLTSGFMGEFLCLTAILGQNSVLGILAASSMLFSTVYSILLFNRVFLGNLKLNLHLLTSKGTSSSINSLHSLDLTVNEALIILPCIALTVYFGIFPSSLLMDYGFNTDVAYHVVDKF